MYQRALLTEGLFDWFGGVDVLHFVVVDFDVSSGHEYLDLIDCREHGSGAGKKKVR